MKVMQGAHIYWQIEVWTQEFQEFWAPLRDICEDLYSKNFCGRDFKCASKLLGLTREHWDESYDIKQILSTMSLA